MVDPFVSNRHQLTSVFFASGLLCFSVSLAHPGTVAVRVGREGWFEVLAAGRGCGLRPGHLVTAGIGHISAGSVGL
jgi:hypothetical protein